MMNTPWKQPRLASLLAILCAFPLGTHAQQVDNDHNDIEEIVVVARHLYTDRVNALKTPTPIIDVPQSLSIVTSDEITLQGFESIGDIVDYTPGVSTSQGEGHRDAVVFRGVRSTADFFIDGARDDVQYYRPLYNLEQVEILRGPNALLFGRGGTGGILNRVTKKGVIGETFSGYKAGINTFGQLDVQLDTNLATSDISAVRINAFYEGLDNHRDFYAGDRYGVNPTATVELGTATSLDLSYEYIDHQRFIDRGIPTGSDGKPVKAFEDVVFADPELNTTNITAHLFRAALQHDFTQNLKGNFSAFFGDYDKLYQNLYASRYDQATTPGEVTLDGYVDTTQRQNLILSANLVAQFATGGINHTLLAGAEHIDTASDQDRFNTFWDTSEDDKEVFAIARPLGLHLGVGMNASGAPTSNNFALDLNDDTRVDVRVLSAYLQNEIEISPNWLLLLGARLDRFDIDVLNVPANDARSRQDEEVSPRLGLIFKPHERISLYASYSESFLPRSGEQFANINGSNDQLDPNTFSNLEAGLKWGISRDLNLNLAVFEIEQRSPQVADDDPATFDVIESEVSGFEAQLKGQVGRNWFVSAGYSYIEGEQVGRSGPTGRSPRELPEHLFSVYGHWKATDRLGLGLGVIHQDDSFINNANSATLPGYTRFDASAFFDFSDTMRIQINVENLTDELYFPNAHSTHQVSVGAPLNARLTVTSRF